MAEPRYKDVVIGEDKYRVDFDGRFVEVSLIAAAPSSFGWEYPYKILVEGMERANAIWFAGKSLSNSKWWKEAHKRAGNYIFDNS